MSDRKTPLEQILKVGGKNYTSLGAAVFAVTALVILTLSLFNVGGLGTKTDAMVGGLVMTVLPAICIFAYSHLTQSYFHQAYVLVFVSLAAFLNARIPIFGAGPVAASVLTADRIMFAVFAFVAILFFLFRLMPNLLSFLALYPAGEAAARLM